jgi:hypothetical protein
LINGGVSTSFASTTLSCAIVVGVAEKEVMQDKNRMPNKNMIPFIMVIG